jgi:hypothetical protein
MEQTYGAMPNSSMVSQLSFLISLFWVNAGADVMLHGAYNWQLTISLASHSNID